MAGGRLLALSTASVTTMLLRDSDSERRGREGQGDGSSKQVMEGGSPLFAQRNKMRRWQVQTFERQTNTKGNLHLPAQAGVPDLHAQPEAAK